MSAPEDNPADDVQPTESEWDEYESDDANCCYHCGGVGFVVICCDDLCHGAGHCMHGDGEEDCPVCNADGWREWIIY